MATNLPSLKGGWSKLKVPIASYQNFDRLFLVFDLNVHETVGNGCALRHRDPDVD
jgi:hypothetical protein